MRTGNPPINSTAPPVNDQLTLMHPGTGGSGASSADQPRGATSDDSRVNFGEIEPGHQEMFDRAAAFSLAQQTRKFPTTHKERDTAGPGRLDPQMSTAQLPLVDARSVIFKRRREEASLLETADSRVNWIAQNPPRSVANGYLAKVAADNESVFAMANTSLSLAKLYDASFLHIWIEIEPRRLTPKRREELARMERQYAAKMAVADGTAEVKPCAQCKRHGHGAGTCVVPNPYDGSITPCPLCNTTDHTFDYCKDVEAAKTTSADEFSSPRWPPCSWASAQTGPRSGAPGCHSPTF